MSTVRELLKDARVNLSEMEDPLLESQLLLAHVLGCDKVKLITWPDQVVTPQQITEFLTLVARRKQHEPIAYIIGSQEFWSLPFYVNQHTLIPRPETELLIEVVLNLLPIDSLRIIDAGTGSGIIACTLAHMRPMWKIVATDISADALSVAKKNAINLKLPNIQFVQTVWCVGLEGAQYDAIISNPPYIKTGDPHLTQGDLPFEPQQALIGGISGLEAYKEIIAQATALLKPGGLLAFEHGYDQGAAVRELLHEAGFENVTTYTDLAGHPRVTVGVRTILNGLRV